STHTSPPSLHDALPLSPRVALPRDAEQAELVLSVAARSLMARGLVLPEEGDATSDDAGSTSTDGVGSTDDESDDWMATDGAGRRSEEHTSELQSRENIV